MKGLKLIYYRLYWHIKKLQTLKRNPVVTVTPKEGQDAKRIQLAVDYLSHKYGGGTIKLSTGTFTPESTIVLKDGIKLEGS